jgi:hypothetical protein
LFGKRVTFGAQQAAACDRFKCLLAISNKALLLTDELPDIAKFLRDLSERTGPVTIARLIEEYRDSLSSVRDFDPLRLAASFAGLLTVPELQSNCIRLEALVHISLALAQGRRKPTDKIIAGLFADFGKGRTGSQEDPSEDVFVALIRSPRGNFRVLEGTWESAGFCLQQVVDALERIPSGSPYDDIREAVYALLRLSDAVCERAKLSRYELGNEIPQDALSNKLVNSLSSVRRVVRFSEADLVGLGIAASHLAEFGFNPSTRSALGSEGVGHSTLERFPVAHRNGEFFLLLPTAVSVAIRRFVVERMSSLRLLDVFAATLAYQHARLFSETPLLGMESGAPIEFQKTEDGLLAGAMTTADRGLYINFVFFADTLEEFADKGLMGTYPPSDPSKLDALIELWIDEAYNEAAQRADFREGLTVLVGCGIGRALRIQRPKKHRDNWRLEFISAPDLVTLSWLKGFKALSLWRLIDSQERLEELGVALQNINGLLNMIGWARSLGGHLVPHGDLPVDFGVKGGGAFVMVQQNAIRSVRHEALVDWNPHVTQDVEGKWINVRKDSQALFAEDENALFFMAEDKYAGERWPRGVFETNTRSWWVHFTTSADTSGHWAYQRAMMLKTWIRRMAPVLEAMLPDLPAGSLLWHVEFTGQIGDREGNGECAFLPYEAALDAISFSILGDGRTLRIIASQEFENAIYHPQNIAERALVQRSVEGFARLAGVDLGEERIQEAVGQIVQNASARQSHAFMARHFRDFVQDSVWSKPVKVDADDAAWLKLGLGWRKRSMDEGGDIQGRENCTAYLNATVRELEDEVCADLRALDRRSVILFALNNHEAAMNDRDNWRRTASALLALHSDKEATLQTMAEHEFELNAVFQASRLMVEFAICESPMTGGRIPGRLEMSRLMAKLLNISGLGGWSAAIHWEAMEPRVRITPLGDIHANVSFQTEVLTPYARAGSDLQIEEAVEGYAENLEQPVPIPTDQSAFPQEFWSALEEECGAPFDATRRFLDLLDDVGMKQGRAIYSIKRSELMALAAGDDGIGPDAAKGLIEFLAFESRPSWRNVPEGYDERDRFPWRFRRRLTILRKPLVQLGDADDPDMVVAPGIVRDGFAYMVGNYHRGDFPRWQLKPKMRAWAGRSRDRIGHEFGQEVARRMRELGWEAETEVAVTKLLRKGFDQNFGDVDVLAWRKENGRVLIMECKDVQHRKIEGEIAEQLADFRGKLRTDGKPDDLLKHLRRVEIISAHANEVASYVGLEDAPKIEGHLVFRHPVPMKFAQQRMEARTTVDLLVDLPSI